MVILEGRSNRYIGLSIDTKPYVGVQADGSTLEATDIPAGSSFLESDTGKIYRWDGQRWSYPNHPNASQDVQAELTDAVRALHLEVAALRIGMIDAGTCKEVNQNDLVLA